MVMNALVTPSDQRAAHSKPLLGFPAGAAAELAPTTFSSFTPHSLRGAPSLQGSIGDIFCSTLLLLVVA